jgi:hypothetical protein
MAAPSLSRLLGEWSPKGVERIPCFTSCAVPIKNSKGFRRVDEAGWALTWPAPPPVINRDKVAALFTPCLPGSDVEQKRTNTLAFYDWWVDVLRSKGIAP